MHQKERQAINNVKNPDLACQRTQIWVPDRICQAVDPSTPYYGCRASAFQGKAALPHDLQVRTARMTWSPA